MLHCYEKHLEYDELKLAVNAIYDATQLPYVNGKFILKLFRFKFQEIHHITGNFHCKITNDFRNNIICLGDMGVIQSKIHLGYQSMAPMRAKKQGFMILCIIKFSLPTSILVLPPKIIFCCCCFPS